MAYLTQVDGTLDIPINEFDGVVTYGEKKVGAGGVVYESHVELLKPSVLGLAELEHTVLRAHIMEVPHAFPS